MSTFTPHYIIMVKGLLQSSLYNMNCLAHTTVKQPANLCILIFCCCSRRLDSPSSPRQPGLPDLPTEGLYLGAVHVREAARERPRVLTQLSTVAGPPGEWRRKEVLFLVWVYIIRCSFSKKANEEQNVVLVLVSQKIGYKKHF